MFRVAFSLALAVTTALAAPALSQGNPTGEQACFDRRADQPADLDNRLAACLAVINDSDLRADIRAEARLRRALAYAQRAAQSNSKDDMDRAILDLSMGLHLDPDNRAAESYVYQMRGGLYFHRGDHDLALADYTALIRLQPNSATVYHYRGVVYAAKGAHEQAIADFTEAIRLEPTVARVHNQRAWSYLQTGKMAEALADANRAVALDPSDGASYSTRIVLNRALGKDSEVISDLRKALSLDPSNEGIREELQKAEQAQPAAREAVAREPVGNSKKDTAQSEEREKQLLEQVRKAQDAAKAAEQERQAALKAAEEARRAAQEAQQRLAELKAQEAIKATASPASTQDPPRAAGAPTPQAKSTEAEPSKAKEAATPSEDLTRMASVHKPEAAKSKELDPRGADPAKLARDLQKELKRVGCDPGALDGKWGKKAQSALQKFASHTSLTLPFAEPTTAALDAVIAKKDRACPLECDDDEIEVKGKCVAKSSKAKEEKGEGRQTSSRPSQQDTGGSNAAGPGTCNATSCSQARSGCVRRCPGGATPPCMQYCNSQYEDCMQTGVFIGKFCGRKAGLSKH
jgi:tetratricopeptide (TPR) repeat protein